MTCVSGCQHVLDVQDDWPALDEAACEACVAEGTGWVSLRRCLSCGNVGCCDSSPGRHATAHYRRTRHPVIRALRPGQDWVWCYVEERSLRRHDGQWRDVDLFFEVGLGYMREHLEAGGSAEVDLESTFGEGFPLGAWAAEMRRRRAAGQLDDDQSSALAELPGWSWG